MCALRNALRLRVGAGAAAGYKLVARAAARYRSLGRSGGAGSENARARQRAGVSHACAGQLRKPGTGEKHYKRRASEYPRRSGKMRRGAHGARNARQRVLSHARVRELFASGRAVQLAARYHRRGAGAQLVVRRVSAAVRFGHRAEQSAGCNERA